MCNVENIKIGYNKTMQSEMLKNPLLIVILLWSIPWKIVALWKSARNNDKWWFGTFLFINLVAIPEILYIFYFNNKNVRKKSSPKKAENTN